MSINITIKVKFYDITKRLLLSEDFESQKKAIIKSFSFSNESIFDVLELIYRTQEDNNKIILINSKEFNTIREMIKNNKVKGSVKFELIKKEDIIGEIINRNQTSTKNNSNNCNISQEKDRNVLVNYNNDDLKFIKVDNNKSNDNGDNSLNYINTNNNNNNNNNNTNNNLIAEKQVNNNLAEHNNSDFCLLKNSHDIYQGKLFKNPDNSNINRINETNAFSSLNHNNNFYEEIKIQNILRNEMELIQQSLLTTINSTINASMIEANKDIIGKNTKSLYYNHADFNDTSNIKKNNDRIELACSECSNRNQEEYVYYCLHPICINKVICRNCEDNHNILNCNNYIVNDLKHILVKSYSILEIKSQQPFDNMNKNINDNKEFAFKCLNTKLEDIVIKQGKDYTLSLVMQNSGTKYWSKNFQIYCLDNSEIIGDTVILPTKFSPYSEFTIEVKLITKNKEKGNYKSYWGMKDNFNKAFGEVICISLIIY